MEIDKTIKKNIHIRQLLVMTEVNVELRFTIVLFFWIFIPGQWSPYYVYLCELYL